MAQVKLDKKDSLRALLTDTSTGEVPIIFSNDGLYINTHSYQQSHSSTSSEIFESLYKHVLNSNGDSQSNPYKYAIKKNQLSLRTLSLIHPKAQLGFCDFYAEYSDVITYLCSKSKISIRSPYKVSNSYYESDSDKSSQYKEIDIDTLSNELARKHSSSFFSYHGYNRLYKFFGSNDYVRLEKKFPNLWLLDIANCFDSIYTHTISWAIKNKTYIKSSIDYRNQFCNHFDRLMQRSNNNETNGIPIGSEVSRIFSEIIFQIIDINVIETAFDNYNLKYGEDYIVYRYVDDYILFSKSQTVAENIARSISDSLNDYNLYLSDIKLKKYERPFNTEKSNIITQVKRVLSDFEKKVLNIEVINEKRVITPKKINKKEAVIKYFIEQIKYACNLDSSGYSNISSYLISTLSNRVVNVIDSYSSAITEDSGNKNLLYRDVLVTFIRLLFFFYTVSPQVISSYKLSRTIIILDKFFITRAPEFSNYYRTMIMEEVSELSFNIEESLRVGCAPLESLNILIATSDFGQNYLISKSKLRFFFNKNMQTSYFTLVSLLFYIKNHQKYDEIKVLIEDEIIKKLLGNGKITSDSEIAHLFLDTLSCPYISIKVREKLLKSYIEEYDPIIILDQEKSTQFLSKLQSVYWFIKWQELDLIKLLERKELSQSY